MAICYDSALLSLRLGVERAVMEYQQTSSDFGLNFSISKSKQMVTGSLVEESDRAPVALEGGDTKMVNWVLLSWVSHYQFWTIDCGDVDKGWLKRQGPSEL